MNDDFDDLDRALFALPLATPPAGLRDAILRATIYRTAAAPAPFNVWETWGIGIALAVAAWLVTLSVGDKNFSATAALYARLALHEFGEPATLAWLATGVSIVLLFVFSNFFDALRLPVRNGRA